MKVSKEPSTFYKEKLKILPYAKYAIALRATLMLEEGDSLLIDAGTSLTPIAKIIESMTNKYSEYTHFTIMTHNREAFESLIDANVEARLNIFQTGGRYDKDLDASFGHQAKNAYENYHPKWVFIGQSGIDADMGLFCHGNTEELSLKNVIFCKPAFCRVIISDFTKLGIPGGLLFGSSDKLTDNVDHCILLTNEPRYELEKRDELKVRLGERPEFYYKKYERQVSILSDTHNVKIIPVKYDIEIMENDLIKLALSYAPPPEKGAIWMGLEKDKKNWIIIKKGEENDKWEIKEIYIDEYEKKGSNDFNKDKNDYDKTEINKTSIKKHNGDKK